jgi:hypothetical protein
MGKALMALSYQFRERCLGFLIHYTLEYLELEGDAAERQEQTWSGLIVCQFGCVVFVKKILIRVV